MWCFDYDLSYCIIYNICILITKGIFCFFYSFTNRQLILKVTGVLDIQKATLTFIVLSCHLFFLIYVLMFFWGGVEFFLAFEHFKTSSDIPLKSSCTWCLCCLKVLWCRTCFFNLPLTSFLPLCTLLCSAILFILRAYKVKSGCLNI